MNFRHKLKAHTSKIVSSFKTPTLICTLGREYKVNEWKISF